MIVSLSELDREALVRILREPKNSLMKQYVKLFDLDDVELEFEESALDAVAKKALDRNTGARGLRSIMEETMVKLMYDIPSRDDVKKVIITAECIEGTGEPVIVTK